MRGRSAVCGRPIRLKMAGLLVTLVLLSTLACQSASDDGAGTVKLVYRAHRLETIYSLVCNDGMTLEDFSSVNQSAKLTFAWIVACPPPRVSFASSLRTLNIYITGLKTLHLTLYKPSELNKDHFKGLSITELEVDNYNESPVEVDVSSIETLHKLTVWGNLLSLPRSRHFKIVKLGYGGSGGVWSDCSGMQRLELKGWRILEPAAGAGWLSRCPLLRELVLADVSPTTVRRALAGGVGRLALLAVHTTALTYVSDELLAGAAEVQALDLSSCKLSDIHRSALPPLLEELNLSENNLWNMSGLLAALAPLRQLRVLHLDKNYALNFCAGWSPSVPPVAPLLQSMSLRHTKLQRLDCFGRWESLKVLDVNLNEITVLEFDNLPSPKSYPLLVDLRNNQIQKILPETEEGYKNILARYRWAVNVTVVVSVVLDCDCRHGWAARALRDLAPRLALAGARCGRGGELSAAPSERLACDKSACAGCACRRAWRDRALEADCRSARWRAVPRVPGASALLARGNRIGTLRPDDFPDTLQRVDLRDNKITRVDEHATAALFALRTRSVLLAGNPLACDCDNRPLLAALSAHRSQIEDYDNITCAGARSILLADVALDELCDKLEPSLAWLVGALLVTAALALALSTLLCLRYKRQIQMFLYTRGCCLSYLREELEADREYDAFVSFCHEDDSFVNEHILPQLRDYRLCIHYRDWIAGEWISAQISRSIDQSSRTIIVLSRNFLDSVWGMLEFRMAHASTRQEGRPRLIVVLVDDVLDDPRLDAELRGYLSTNTYVRWGEKWFWNKLRFALPHRPRSNPSEVEEDGAAPGLELSTREMAS